MGNFSVEFSKTYTSGSLVPTIKVRIEVQDTYNALTNQSVVSLSDVYIYSSLNFGSVPVHGKVTLNDNVVADFDGGSGNTVVANTEYNACTYYSSYGSITVSHNSSGIASVKIGVEVSEVYSSRKTFGFVYNHNIYGVDAPQSKTINITTHTSTLTVDPNGGIWNNSTSIQTFNQAPTSTLTISNPTRNNYRFIGWSLSGGGSFNNSIYTYGSTNGTLTANWEPNSYIVTCEDRVGSTSGILLGSNTNNYIYGTTAKGSDFGSNTAYNIYYTGYYYVSSTSATVTGEITIYRIFAVNIYTLSVITPSQGVTTNISRVSSPLGGGSIGQITNGAILYYNDVLSINYTLGGAYQLISATVNNIDISDNVPYSLTINGNVVVNISVKLGAIVYIGNEAYQAFIGTLVNGNVIWQQYQAFIGNGSTYDQY